MPTTEIIVIRHGETLWNNQGRWQGHFNSPLSETGIKQAKLVAERFANSIFSALYSSDLGRAIQTAEMISKATNHQIVQYSRLRERNLGVFEGLTISEIEEKYPEEYEKYRSLDPDHIIPDGESVRQFSERVIECITEIEQRHSGETILVVAHGGVLRQLFKYVVEMPLKSPRKYTLINSSVNIFTCRDNNWFLKTWGDISHLNNLRADDDV